MSRSAPSRFFLFSFLVFVFLLPVGAIASAPPTLRGVVLDPADASVSDAEVLVTAGAEVVQRATTREDGTFEIRALPPGRYQLHVAREGFRSIPQDVSVRPGSASTVTLRLQVSAVSEAVVVSAAQVDLPLSRTPAATTVITREDLRAYQQTTVADALRHVPGLSLARTGSEGAVTSLFSRGGESDFTAVAIDGVPVNSFGGSYDLGHLTTGDVERVEVVRGPQSALWSGGAIGGVINVVTQTDAPLTFGASAEAGGRGGDRAILETVIPAGSWRFSVSGERQTSDGLNGRAFKGGRVTNDDWRSEHLTANVRRDGATRIALTTRAERSERGYPGAYGSDPGHTYSGIDGVSRGRNRTLVTGLSASRTFSHVRPSAHVSWFRLNSDFLDSFVGSESGSRRLTAGGQADVRIASALSASAGAEWLRERATSSYITGTAGTGVPVNRSVAAGFAEARLDLARVFVTAGLRVEEIRRDRLDADPFSFTPRPVLAEDTITAVTPRISASWFVRPLDARGSWTRLRASAGLGIRPPDAFELAFTDNPALKPERTRSAEVGIEQALAGGRLLADATLFVNHYDDLIVTVGRTISNASRYQSDNISNARARGLELLLSARSARGLSATAGYTFLDSEVLAIDRLGIAPPPFKAGDPLIRRPRHQGWIESRWRGSVADAFVTLGARGDTLDIDPTYGAFGGLYASRGYAVVSAGGGWRITHRLHAFGRVKNLFNTEHEEVLGFPAPPRTVYAGLRVDVR